MPKDWSSKSKEWERDRRERLNTCFNILRSLLPCYDPSITLPKVEILQRAIKYINELQFTNEELLDSKIKHVHAKHLKNLRQRIDSLITRADQLSKLLKDANIAIPVVSPPKSLFPKHQTNLKWENKLDCDNVTNLLEKTKIRKSYLRKQKLKSRKCKKENNVSDTSDENNCKISEKNKEQDAIEVVSKTSEKNNIPEVSDKTSGMVVVTSGKAIHSTYSKASVSNKSSVCKTASTSNCFTISNTKPFDLKNIPNLSVPHVKSNVCLSGVPACGPPAVIAGPGLCPGTLILANGNIVPVLPTPVIAAPTQFIVNTPICNSVTQLPSSPIIMVQKTLVTSSSITSSFPTKSRQPLAAKPPVRTKKDSTVTTFVNKVPIPALTVSKHQPLQLLSLANNSGNNQYNNVVSVTNSRSAKSTETKVRVMNLRATKKFSVPTKLEQERKSKRKVSTVNKKIVKKVLKSIESLKSQKLNNINSITNEPTIPNDEAVAKDVSENVIVDNSGEDNTESHIPATTSEILCDSHAVTDSSRKETLKRSITNCDAAEVGNEIKRKKIESKNINRDGKKISAELEIGELNKKCMYNVDFVTEHTLQEKMISEIHDKPNYISLSHTQTSSVKTNAGSSTLVTINSLVEDTIQNKAIATKDLPNLKSKTSANSLEGLTEVKAIEQTESAPQKIRQEHLKTLENISEKDNEQGELKTKSDQQLNKNKNIKEKELLEENNDYKNKYLTQMDSSDEVAVTSKITLQAANSTFDTSVCDENKYSSASELCLLDSNEATKISTKYTESVKNITALIGAVNKNNLLDDISNQKTSNPQCATPKDVADTISIPIASERSRNTNILHNNVSNLQQENTYEKYDSISNINNSHVQCNNGKSEQIVNNFECENGSLISKNNNLQLGVSNARREDIISRSEESNRECKDSNLQPEVITVQSEHSILGCEKSNMVCKDNSLEHEVSNSQSEHIISHPKESNRECKDSNLQQEVITVQSEHSNLGCEKSNMVCEDSNLQHEVSNAQSEHIVSHPKESNRECKDSNLQQEVINVQSEHGSLDCEKSNMACEDSNLQLQVSNAQSENSIMRNELENITCKDSLQHGVCNEVCEDINLQQRADNQSEQSISNNKENDIQYIDSNLQQRDNNVQSEHSIVQHIENNIQCKDNSLQQRVDVHNEHSILNNKERNAQHKDVNLQQRVNNVQSEHSIFQHKESNIQYKESNKQCKNGKTKYGDNIVQSENNILPHKKSNIHCINNNIECGINNVQNEHSIINYEDSNTQCKDNSIQHEVSNVLCEDSILQHKECDVNRKNNLEERIINVSGEDCISHHKKDNVSHKSELQKTTPLMKSSNAENIYNNNSNESNVKNSSSEPLTLHVTDTNTCTSMTSYANMFYTTKVNSSKDVLSPPEFHSHEFSGDLFASLQVPSEPHHPESISPTAAFLLAFPLVSTSKVSDIIDSQEDTGSDSLQEPSTLLEIGDIEQSKTTKISDNITEGNEKSDFMKSTFESSKKRSTVLNNTNDKGTLASVSQFNEEWLKLECPVSELSVSSSSVEPKTKSVGTQFHSDCGNKMQSIVKSLTSESTSDTNSHCKTDKNKDYALNSGIQITSNQEYPWSELNTTHARSDSSTIFGTSFNNTNNNNVSNLLKTATESHNFRKHLVADDTKGSAVNSREKESCNFFDQKKNNLLDHKNLKPECNISRQSKNKTNYCDNKQSFSVSNQHMPSTCDSRGDLSALAIPCSVMCNTGDFLNTVTYSSTSTNSHSNLGHQSGGLIPVVPQNAPYLNISSWKASSESSIANSKEFRSIFSTSNTDLQCHNNTTGTPKEMRISDMSNMSKESNEKICNTIKGQTDNNINKSGGFNRKQSDFVNSTKSGDKSSHLSQTYSNTLSEPVVNFPSVSHSQRAPVNWMTAPVRSTVTSTHTSKKVQDPSKEEDKVFKNMYPSIPVSVFESRTYANSSVHASVPTHSGIYGYQEHNALNVKYTESMPHIGSAYSSSVTSSHIAQPDQKHFHSLLDNVQSMPMPWTQKRDLPSDISHGIYIPSTLPTLTGDLALGTMSSTDDNNFGRCVLSMSEEDKKSLPHISLLEDLPTSAQKDGKVKSKNKTSATISAVSEDYNSGSSISFLSISQLAESAKSEILPNLNVTPSQQNVISSKQLEQIMQVKNTETGNTFLKIVDNDNSHIEKPVSLPQVTSNLLKSKSNGLQNNNPKQYLPTSDSWIKPNTSSASNKVVQRLENTIDKNSVTSQDMKSNHFLAASNISSWSNDIYPCPSSLTTSVPQITSKYNPLKPGFSDNLNSKKNPPVSNASAWLGDTYLATNAATPSLSYKDDSKKKGDVLRYSNSETFPSLPNTSIWTNDMYAVAHTTNLTTPHVCTESNSKKGNGSQNLTSTSISSGWIGNTYSLEPTINTQASSSGSGYVMNLPSIAVSETHTRKQSDSSQNLALSSSLWSNSSYSSAALLNTTQAVADNSKKNDSSLQNLNMKQSLPTAASSNWPSSSSSNYSAGSVPNFTVSHLGNTSNKTKIGNSQNLNQNFLSVSSASTWVNDNSNLALSHPTVRENKRKDSSLQNVNSKHSSKPVASTWPSYSTSSVSESTLPHLAVSGENKKTNVSQNLNPKQFPTMSEASSNWADELNFSSSKQSNIGPLTYKTPVSSYSAEALIGPNVSKSVTHDPCQKLLPLPPPVVSDRFGHRQTYVKHTPVSMPPPFGGNSVLTGSYVNGMDSAVNHVQDISGNSNLFPTQSSGFSQTCYGINTFSYPPITCSTATSVLYEKPNTAHYSSPNFAGNTQMNSVGLPVTLGTTFFPSVTASNSFSSNIVLPENSAAVSTPKSFPSSKGTSQKNTKQNLLYTNVTSAAHHPHSSFQHSANESIPLTGPPVNEFIANGNLNNTGNTSVTGICPEGKQRAKKKTHAGAVTGSSGLSAVTGSSGLSAVTGSSGLSGQADFTYLSIPPGLNSPLLADDGIFSTNFLPPQPALYPGTPPRPNFPPCTPHSIPRTLQHTAAISSGTTVANFNLSTIFPEINDKGSSSVYTGMNKNSIHTTSGNYSHYPGPLSNSNDCPGSHRIPPQPSSADINKFISNTPRLTGMQWP